MDLNKLESRFRFISEGGMGKENGLVKQATKDELIALIFQLLEDVRQPRIDGVKMLEGPVGQVPALIEKGKNETYHDGYDGITVKSSIPPDGDRAWVSINPYEGRIEVNAGWTEENHPVIRTQIYNDEMSAGSSVKGQEFSLERPKSDQQWQQCLRT